MSLFPSLTNKQGGVFGGSPIYSMPTTKLPSNVGLKTQKARRSQNKTKKITKETFSKVPNSRTRVWGSNSWEPGKTFGCVPQFSRFPQSEQNFNDKSRRHQSGKSIFRNERRDTRITGLSFHSVLELSKSKEDFRDEERFKKYFSVKETRIKQSVYSRSR